MEFEWDSSKAEANLKKHRIPFAVAEVAFQDEARLERLDDSGEHAEERWSLLGRVGFTVLFVVYTYRGGTIRLISARKADRHEQHLYWNDPTHP